MFKICLTEFSWICHRNQRAKWEFKKKTGANLEQTVCENNVNSTKSKWYLNNGESAETFISTEKKWKNEMKLFGAHKLHRNEQWTIKWQWPRANSKIKRRHKESTNTGDNKTIKKKKWIIQFGLSPERLNRNDKLRHGTRKRMNDQVNRAAEQTKI